MCGVRQVAFDQYGLASGILDELRRIPGVRVLAQVGDQHVGSLAGKSYRHCPADAAVAARDDCRLPLHLGVTDIATLTTVRSRRHLGLCPRYILLLCRLAHVTPRLVGREG